MLLLLLRARADLYRLMQGNAEIVAGGGGDRAGRPGKLRGKGEGRRGKKARTARRSRWTRPHV
jgi:hypothetical protein